MPRENNTWWVGTFSFSLDTFFYVIYWMILVKLIIGLLSGSFLGLTNKTASLEIPPTIGLLFLFEKKTFEFDAPQNSNMLTETNTGTLK